MRNIMIDTETLGTSAGCVVLSIGAVEFDEHKIYTQFHIHIDPESCTDAGLNIDTRTVLWWLDQSKDAQNALLKGTTVPLTDALDQFSAAFNWEGVKVWCNGADFDFPILDAAYKAVGKKVPWKYWSKMDYRTLKNLVPKPIYEDLKFEPVVKHDAHADAVAQALTTQALLAWLSNLDAEKYSKAA